MAAKHVVTGDQYRDIDVRMMEIKRQLRQKGGSPLNPERVVEALQRIIEGEFIGETRFGAAIRVCHFDNVSPGVTPENFPEAVFGDVGEGHMLAHPPQSQTGRWAEVEIDQWFAKKAKEGYEAGTLADGLDWASKNQDVHLEDSVVFWASVSSDGSVAYLYWHDKKLCLGVLRRGASWRDDCWFLLRKIKNPT